ncbi:class I glutamine amidotransferase-like protein [Teratosphaeria destructans]|uniref:Class I glutamine amidotransferase-like protein n=1 Tax=Teratosphaeria destructans TaxID=418781 RepID=A0A9W7SIG8_9PEZI|nr:class I glutamine amidotransferase-like protein [Teratosphaeria destructans]
MPTATGHVRAVFLMADYGHDPVSDPMIEWPLATECLAAADRYCAQTETAIPWTRFTEAGFSWLDAEAARRDPVALAAYTQMTQSPEWQHPLAWVEESFTLAAYEIVFLPGGHDKAIRQILDSARAQHLLAEYFPLTVKPSTHICVAICHGVQVLAHAKTADGISVLHNVATTALPGITESSVYHGTRLVLGDYYKTYGGNSPTVETVVRKALKSPNKQWLCSAILTSPFVVEDKFHNYISGRWPGDAEVLSRKTIEMARAVASL